MNALIDHNQNPMPQDGGGPAEPDGPPDKLEEAISHNRNVAGMMADLLANPNLTSKDVLTGLTDAMRAGSITPQMAASEAAALPTDPQQIRQYLMMHFLKNMDVGRQLMSMRGAQASQGGNSLVSPPATPSPVNPLMGM